MSVTAYLSAKAVAYAPTIVAPPAANGQAPQIDWTPSADFVKYSRFVGGALIAIWIIYLIAQVAMPGRRGGGGRIQWGKTIGGVAVGCLLMAPQSIPGIINLSMKAVWAVGAFVGLTDYQA